MYPQTLRGRGAHFAIQALGWMVGELSVASAYQRHLPSTATPILPQTTGRVNGVEPTLGRPLRLSVLGGHLVTTTAPWHLPLVPQTPSKFTLSSNVHVL